MYLHIWMYFMFSVIFLTALICFIYFLYKRAHQLRNNKNSETISCSLSINQVTNVDECKRALSMLLDECKELSALGFDCEWVTEVTDGKPVQKPVSLLQLASKNRLCCLFRLNELGSIPPELKLLLENEKILKLGVNCKQDSKLIEKDYGVKVRSCLDLRHLYPGETSLASLAKNVIDVHLIKDVSISCTNWNQKILTEDQITYAAKDAWVAIEIFKSWLKTNSLTDKSIDELGIEKFIDLPFNLKKKDNKSLNYIKDSFCLKNITAKFARKSPLYHNCWMYAPDGELLCSCDKRKAEWYVTKGLAEVYEKEPFSIKLLFEPNSRPNDLDGEFYKQMKKNCCVICNSQQSCMRHYVVPREYRKHFPSSMKSHQSHDIVLTCIYCHSKAKMHMRKLKEELAEKCNAPMYKSPSLKRKQNQKVKNICRTLLTSGANIPKERREALEKIVKEYSGLPNVDNETLEEISNKKIVEEDEDLDNHGRKVVEHYMANGQLTKLEELWRKSFLDNMSPRFLPHAWSVNHNHKNPV